MPQGVEIIKCDRSFCGHFPIACSFATFVVQKGEKTPPPGASQRPACETLIRSPKPPKPSNRLERQSKWRNLGDEPRPSRGFDDPIAALGNAIGVFKLTTVLHAVGSHRQIARLLARSKGTTRGVETHVQLVCKRTNRRAHAMARCPTALFYQCQHMNVPITNYDIDGYRERYFPRHASLLSCVLAAIQHAAKPRGARGRFKVASANRPIKSNWSREIVELQVDFEDPPPLFNSTVIMRPTTDPSRPTYLYARSM